MKPPRILLAALFATAITLPLSAQSGSSEHPGAVVLLLGSDNVRKELGLTSLQRAILDSLRQEYLEKVQNLTRPNPSTPQAAGNSIVALDAIEQTYNQRALSALNPRQRTQLRSIEHTVAGGMMLLVPSVQEQLGLSGSQAKKIDAYGRQLENTNQKLIRQVEGGQITPARRLNLLRAERLKTSSRMESVLTPAQLQQLVTLRK